VEEGMCIENSRVNLKYGGQDVTETFVKMMLHDHVKDLWRNAGFIHGADVLLKLFGQKEVMSTP
jgi:actin-related protein 8